MIGSMLSQTPAQQAACRRLIITTSPCVAHLETLRWQENYVSAHLNGLRRSLAGTQ
jgi:hypothetical protein